MRTALSIALLAIPCALWAQPPEKANPAGKSIDDKFVIGVRQGSQFEVQASTMALQRASNPEVKRFAQTMIDDHTKMANELNKIAPDSSRTGAVALDPVHAAMLTKLASEQGKDFDECYLGMQVLCHEGALICFRKEAKKGSNPQLRGFAEQALPKLREHLQMARKMTDGGMDSAQDAIKSHSKD